MRHMNEDMRADGYATTPEVRLWQSVLARALEDSVWPEGVSPTERARLMADARKWLTRPSESFDLVCSICSLQPDKVRAIAADIIAEANANPRKPRGAGPRTRGEGQNFADTIRDPHRAR